MRPCARLVLASLASLAAAGCATTVVSMPEGSTTITTVPGGAQVFINGTEVCATTPCNWNEGNGLAHRYHLQVRKEGYQEVDLYLDKELRFFSQFLSFANYQIPRQVALTLESAGSGPPPEQPAPPAQPAPSPAPAP